MKPTVYIETTIPSYYFSRRTNIGLDIERTREWWDRERTYYECFVSEIVRTELNAGQIDELTHSRNGLIAELPELPVTQDVRRIAEVYQHEQLMPITSPDAIHVAVASHYRIDFLLTWNCRHIANVNKMVHLQSINRRLGLSVPQLVTPHLLRSPEEAP